MNSSKITNNNNNARKSITYFISHTHTLYLNPYKWTRGREAHVMKLSIVFIVIVIPFHLLHPLGVYFVFFFRYCFFSTPCGVGRHRIFPFVRFVLSVIVFIIFSHRFFFFWRSIALYFRFFWCFFVLHRISHNECKCNRMYANVCVYVCKLHIRCKEETTVKILKCARIFWIFYRLIVDTDFCSMPEGNLYYDAVHGIERDKRNIKLLCMLKKE